MFSTIMTRAAAQVQGLVYYLFDLIAVLTP